jgi:rhodanese-related sulfurtransferase
MKKTKNYTNILYWIVMVGILGWYAYTKGWILANFESIDAKSAIVLIENDDNITLLDVRSIPEYKEGHLVGATLIPLQQLEKNLSKLEKNRKILVYCRSGNRSVAASRILERHGFKPVNIKGGITDLKASGAQIIR